ncbi:protein tramtrack, alpha isoform isoform X1 [Planococcus citri]|uniref:protein tramtrack, alpha isoform isoform X1 n=1 Tax=Planococcus citri TaxID=170843 RepID=UPI0031F85A8E
MTHSSQRFCLRWNNHQSNLLSVFDQLLHDESFVDVTIAVEGQLLRAHKMVLSACSPYFQALFVSHPDKHPIVILKDVPFADMRSLLDFMYRGEVSVDQDRLTAFLKVAESLRIKGLTEVNEEKCDLPSIASSLLSNQHRSTPPPAAPPPPPSLHRIHLTQPSSSASSSSSTTSSNAKRCASSPSNFNPYCGSNASAMYSQKRKRGRPRKLSGGSDTPSGASPEHEMNTDGDLRNSASFADSPYGHGPPDLLEVNMTEHSQNSPSSFSEDHNLGSPEASMVEDDDCCIKTEPNEESGGAAFQECKSPHQKDSPNSRSQSQTPTGQSERYPPDLPMLRLVPKSELLAVYHKDGSGGPSLIKNDLESNSSTSGGNSGAANNNNSSSNSSSNNNNSGGGSLNHSNSGSNSNNNNSGSNTNNSSSNNNLNINNNSNKNNASINNSGIGSGSNNNNSNFISNNNFLLNNSSSHFMLNNDMKFSPPPHLLSPQSNSSNASTPVGGDFSGTPPNKPAPTRRRVRRRATSSSDPAEQLTEMSVRGLNLFRYACIDEGVYKCLECAKTDIVKTFKNKYSFQRHAFLYHEGCQRKVFPCPVCGKEFSRPDKMKNHMKTVHDCFMPKEVMVPKDCIYPAPPTIPFFLSPP